MPASRSWMWAISSASRGEVFRTKTGELSVRVVELTLLAKSLRPLPEKFHGLTDTEMRYRQRYVDLIANPEVKDTFVKRSQILREIRAYLDERGFLEVDTPILTPFEIGASARPFITHHNTLNMDMVLRIETELYLKRLVVGGIDRVYEVGRIFRNEGIGPQAQPRVHHRRAVPGVHRLPRHDGSGGGAVQAAG